jgi:hypothetical protein
MNAKRLEAILAEEFAAAESEMVQRFQNLRDSLLLPVSRGRNATQVSRDQIVSGLLSVVSQRPASAGATATLLRGLVPVGGADAGFAGATTLAQALRLALGDRALRDSIVELRLTDSEVLPDAPGRAAICYAGDAMTYYVQGMAAALLGPGAEHSYDPMDLVFSVIRETVIAPRLLDRLANEHARDAADSHAMAATQ